MSICIVSVMTTIIGIKLTNRTETSPEFQKIISKYGCAIKTRIGLHNTCHSICANFGVILLEVLDENEVLHIKKDLIELDGTIVNSMTL